MKKTILLLLLTFSLANSETKEEVIAKFLNVFKDGDVIQYKIYFKYNDPSRGINEFDTKCIVKIQEKDTLIGGYYNLETISVSNKNMNKDTNLSWTIYNGKEYLSYGPSYFGYGNVTQFTLKDNPIEFQDKWIEEYKYSMPSIPKRNALYNVLLYSLRKQFKDIQISKNFNLLNDTLIDGIDCNQLESFVDARTTKIILNKANKFPIYYRYEVKSRITECFFSEYKINPKLSKNIFSKRFFPKTFVFKPTYYIKSNYLKKDSIAPEFECETIKNTKIKSSEISEKLTLVYVTEIGCYGCILSLPEINQLQKKYNNLKVIGLYALDSKESLVKYSKEQNIVFDIIPKAKEISSKFGVNAYPTFFLIDKNKKVLYSNEGYFKTLNDELTKEIEKSLNIEPK